MRASRSSSGRDSRRGRSSGGKLEDLAVICATALILPLALALADLVGLSMGLGWGHYSGRLKAKRAKKEAETND